MDLGVLPDLAPSCIASAIPAQGFQHPPRNSPGEKGQMLCQTIRTTNCSGPITFLRKGTQQISNSDHLNTLPALSQSQGYSQK